MAPARLGNQYDSPVVEPSTTDRDRRRELVHRALLSPRGRYGADRAAQLSGIPRSTLYEWQRQAVYRPDFVRTKPMAWSYRDLIYLRLLAWMRSQRVERRYAADRVAEVRKASIEGERIEQVRTDGRSVLLNNETRNRSTGQDPFQDIEILDLISAFDLLEPVEELGDRPLWGPDLVNPSERSFISPWVMAGEPCVTDTRIPTSTLYALRVDRRLSTDRIVALYPGVNGNAVDDAIALETRLRRAA